MKKIILALVIFSFPIASHAAEFYFDADESKASVRMDTEGETINAVSGEVPLVGMSVSPVLLTNSSSIVIWIEGPVFEEGKIRFSGITPGGFRGDIELFSISILEGYKGELRVVSGAAHLNDDKGTPAKTVSAPSFVDFRGTSQKREDSVAPERFEPVLGKSEDIRNGAYFVSFYTVDKDTGIKGYEWSASFFKPRSGWQPAEMPLFPAKSAYFKRIYIKATDLAGNERVEVVSGPYYLLTIFGVIILGILAALCVLSFSRRRSLS